MIISEWFDRRWTRIKADYKAGLRLYPHPAPQTWQESEWKPGASWRIMIPDGRVGDAGEILEIEPQKRLVLSWRNEFKPELRAEGFSHLSYELEPQDDDSVKLTLIHEMDRPTQSSLKPYRQAGRTSSRASRAAWKQANRSKQRASGRREHK